MNKVEEAIKEMKADLADLEKSLKDVINGLDPEKKAKAKELLTKTKNVVNVSIDKIKATVDTIKEDEKLEVFLDRVKAKTLEAVDTTKEKINALVNGEEDDTLKNLSKEVMAQFDSLKDNEMVKKATEFFKGLGVEINDFLQKPEVKATIKKAKTTTAKYAKKGVDTLKKAIDSASKATGKKTTTKKTTKKKTTAKKPATKKTTTKKATAKKPVAKKTTTKKTTKK